MCKDKYDFILDTTVKNNSHTGLASRIKPGQRILELGCSSGQLSKFLKQALNCDVVGVDIDANTLQQATPFCVQTIVADLDSDTWLAEIAGQQFDVILCADVLEHLKNPVAMLSNLKAFLQVESMLLASVPNVAHASIRLELLQGHFDYESLGLLDDTHLHFYTRDGLISMLMQAGYVCCDISYSIQDLADEAIDQHLANAGLQASDTARELLHAPDAVAYQFIIEARPVQKEQLQSMPQSLVPKPLVSSGVFYAEKQEKIVALDSALFDLTAQLQQERKENARLSAEVAQLQQVLQRTHHKISYRIVRGIKNIPKTLTRLLAKTNKTGQHKLADFFDYDTWLTVHGDVNKQQLSCYQQETKAWQKSPKIAVLMSVYNTDKACLVNAIESVLQQAYENFELCIADNASTANYVREVLQSYRQKDQRVKVIFRKQNEPISVALNSALSLVDADYVALMNHRDLLTPDALYWIAKTILKHPDAQLIYSDEDKIDLQNKRHTPYFKPDWNPELLLSHNYIGHLAVYKTAQTIALGGFDSSFDGVQDYDLTLRYVAQLKPEQIIHIPRILYHWRTIADSTAKGIEKKPDAEAKIIQAVVNALERQQRPAEVSAHKRLQDTVRVRYLLPKVLPLVSIVIPTRNGFHLLYRCIESIFAKTTYANYELIIIDNGSDDLVTLSYLQRLQEDERVSIIRDTSPFNYAILNNKAVAQAKGEVIALLNNDLQVINAGWLDEMISHVVHSEVGAVGAKLYYPDNTIQHAGVIVGLNGVAGHSHKHFPQDSLGYCGRLLLAQNLSAVTAACLLVRKEVFNAVGGFDAQHLSVAFNDVDLCLRIQQKGFFNVWTPYAELYHYESASRGYEDTPEKQARFNKEVDYMQQRWGEGLLQDPAYNPNLTLNQEDFSFAWPPRYND